MRTLVTMGLSVKVMPLLTKLILVFTGTTYFILCFLDADVGPSPAEDVMAAQQKPKPTHAIEEPLPPPPPSPQSSTPQTTASPSPPQQTTEKVPRSGGKVLAAPAVRKIAMEHDVRRIIADFVFYFYNIH